MGIHEFKAFPPVRLDAYGAVQAAIAALGARPLAAPRDAHAALLAKLAADPPQVIRFVADADDLEARSKHIEDVLDAVTAYITAVMNDTDASTSGGLGAAKLDWLLAGLADLRGDAAGLCEIAADTIREGW